MLTCDECKRAISDGEPVRHTREDPHRSCFGGWVVGSACRKIILCEQCGGGKRTLDREIECRQCRRLIRRNYFASLRTSPFCCRACAVAHQSARAREERAALRGPARPCMECGKHFSPSRDDALYCSSACRQKAYRGRVTTSGAGPGGRTVKRNDVTDSGAGGGLPTVKRNAMTMG
jgi:hypothetical protein